MVPKLTTCDVLGMLQKYFLSFEGGFIGGERVNPDGVLASGLLSGVVAGGDITHSCDVEVVLCDGCCCDVSSCDVCCCDVC